MFSFGSIDHIANISKLYFFNVDSSATIVSNISGMSASSNSNGKFTINFPALPDTNFGIVATAEPSTYSAKKLWTRADVLSTTSAGFMIENLDTSRDASGMSGVIFSTTPESSNVVRSDNYSFGDGSSSKLSGIYRIVCGKCGSAGGLNGCNFDDISSTKVSTGVYRISGNFQSTNYAVILGTKQNNSSARYGIIPSARKATDSFDIWTFNSSGVVSNRAFGFTIVEWS